MALPSKILALDPATRLGWCLLEPGGVPDFGSYRLGRAHCELGEVLACLRGDLERTIEGHLPTLVVFEAPYVPVARAPRLVRAGSVSVPPAASAGPPMNALTVRRLASLAGVIEMVAYEHGIDCRECAPAQITAFFVGKVAKGRGAKKAATVDMCRRSGYDVRDDNQADAVALALFAESRWFPREASRRAISRPARAS